MALWGNNDNRDRQGTVTLDYTTGIVTGSNLESPGAGTSFGEDGSIQVGDVIRIGIDDEVGTYFGDAVVVSIASTVSLTIGHTMGLSGAAIAATAFQGSQLPDYTIVDVSYSKDEDYYDEDATIKTFIVGTAHTFCGVGVSNVAVQNSADPKSHIGQNVVDGDYVLNDSSSIKIIGMGSGLVNANWESPVGYNTVYLDTSMLPGLQLYDFFVATKEDSTSTNTLHTVMSIGSTSVTFDPGSLGTIINAGDNLLFTGQYMIAIASTISAGIATGDAVSFQREHGGNDKVVYGISGDQVDAALGGEYQNSAGWVGVQTYIDCQGNLRVKSEVLVAMSGIETGNQPSYPNINTQVTSYG